MFADVGAANGAIASGATFSLSFIGLPPTMAMGRSMFFEVVLFRPRLRHGAYRLIPDAATIITPGNASRQR
jgi:hypothetical protein